MSDVIAQQVGDGVFWVRAGARKVAYLISVDGPGTGRTEHWYTVSDVGAQGADYAKWGDHRPSADYPSVALHFEYVSAGTNPPTYPNDVTFQHWQHAVTPP